MNEAAHSFCAANDPYSIDFNNNISDRWKEERGVGNRLSVASSDAAWEDNSEGDQVDTAVEPDTWLQSTGVVTRMLQVRSRSRAQSPSLTGRLQKFDQDFRKVIEILNCEDQALDSTLSRLQEEEEAAQQIKKEAGPPPRLEFLHRKISSSGDDRGEGSGSEPLAGTPTPLGLDQVRSTPLPPKGIPKNLTGAEVTEESVQVSKKRKRRVASAIERDFPCVVPDCPKRYGSDGALRTHIRNKHSGVPLPSRNAVTAPIATPISPVIESAPLLQQKKARTSPGSFYAMEFNRGPEMQPVSDTQSAPRISVPLRASSSLRKEAAQGSKVLPLQLSRSVSLPSHFIHTPNSHSQLESNAAAASIVSHSLPVCNVPVLMLKIGQWHRVSTYCGDIPAKFSFSERTFAWEIISSPTLVAKLEIPFDSVDGLGLDIFPDGSVSLVIQAAEPPGFTASSIQPHRPLHWFPCSDFTSNNASQYLCHWLHFPRGSLNAPLDCLLKTEPRLRGLAQNGLRVPMDRTFQRPVVRRVLSTGEVERDTIPEGEPAGSEKDVFSDSQFGNIKAFANPQMANLSQHTEEDYMKQFYSQTTMNSFLFQPPPAPKSQLQQQLGQHRILTKYPLTDCSQEHLWLIHRLSDELLDKQWGLDCCEMVPTLRDLLSEYTCSCGTVHHYCFCHNRPVTAFWHCKSCNVCKPNTNWHCYCCNQCSPGRSCQHCEKNGGFNVQQQIVLPDEGIYNRFTL